MKQYLVYKKQSRLILLLALLLALATLVPVFFSHEETVEELQQKINLKDADIEKL